MGREVHSLSHQSLQYTGARREALHKFIGRDSDTTKATMVCGHFALRVRAALLTCMLAMAVQLRNACDESNQHTSYALETYITVMTWSHAGLNRGPYGY